MKIGDIEIKYLGHSGFLFEIKDGRKLAIDPYNISSKCGKVDYVLITHNHYDHCSIKDISQISDSKTLVIGPPDIQSKIVKINDVEMQVIEIGDVLDFGGIKIEALPAYNVDKDFHPKSEDWLGYLVKAGDVIIYHSGDSDKIPEMRNLTGYGKKGNNFVVLLPVSGKYVMDVEEAVETASFLNPNLAIPMHYGGGVAGTIDDAKRFVELCKEAGLRAEILERLE